MNSFFRLEYLVEFALSQLHLAHGTQQPSAIQIIPTG